MLKQNPVFIRESDVTLRTKFSDTFSLDTLLKTKDLSHCHPLASIQSVQAIALWGRPHFLRIIRVIQRVLQERLLAFRPTGLLPFGRWG